MTVTIGRRELPATVGGPAFSYRAGSALA